MDDITALKLQIEWGADEALLDHPVDRFAPPASVPLPVSTSRHPVPPPSASLVNPAAAAPDLAALLALIDATAHPLRTTASTTVAPSGNPAAGLILIADAPGPDDDRAGQAFSGPPGQLLDRILASAGLTRDHLLLTHLVPWRPPGGRPPSEAEIAFCAPFLARLLALTSPARIVLLGTAPLRALAPGTGTLRQVRGRWLETPIPALPMLAPDLWLKTPQNKQATWADLLTLREKSLTH